MKQSNRLVPGITPLAYLSTKVKLIAGGIMTVFMLSAWFMTSSVPAPQAETAPVSAITQPAELPAQMPATEAQPEKENGSIYTLTVPK